MHTLIKVAVVGIQSLFALSLLLSIPAIIFTDLSATLVLLVAVGFMAALMLLEGLEQRCCGKQ